QHNRYPWFKHWLKVQPYKITPLGFKLLVNYSSAIFVLNVSGPPTVPPQMFDMIPRPQGIVIREPPQDEEYLEQQSPDSVLFKDPSAVLQELTGNSLSQDEIMEEQCAIEADLLAQKLNDASHMLALASKMVPESCKRGPDVSSGKGEEGEPSA
ncbi:hypothetical protein LINGRAHAP2_LOCUS32552, partial [Linum grandiflorum]